LVAPPRPECRAYHSSTPLFIGTDEADRNGGRWDSGLIFKHGAGDETRTRDIFLGKEVLYQLSYARFQQIETPSMRQKIWESSHFLNEQITSGFK
jgi:hypothetical protein